MAHTTILDAFDENKPELTKILAQNLYVQDLINLSLTCVAFYNTFWRSCDSSAGFLLSYTKRCDSTSGDAWKRQWLEECSTSMAQDASFYRILSLASSCEPPILDHQKASRACDGCDKATCNSCRAHFDYGKILKDLDVSLLPSNVNDYSIKCANEIHQWPFFKRFHSRWLSYCDKCEPDAISRAPKMSQSPKLDEECNCTAARFIEDTWICVPCLKKPTTRARYVCASRRRVEGCLGASRGRALFCEKCTCGFWQSKTPGRVDD